MFCKECGTELKNEEAKFCGGCGAKAVREREDADGEHGYCPYCGDALAEEQKFCVKCGGNVEQRTEGESSGFCENCGAKLFGFPAQGSLAGTLRAVGGAVGTMLGGGMALLGKDQKELGTVAGIAGSAAGIRSFCPKCGVKVEQEPRGDLF
jgi:hypothetical protein